MKADYSVYRMNDYKWIDAYITVMGNEAFFRLLHERYTWLMAKPVGWIYNLTMSKILKTDNDIDLFVKTGCLFISEGHGDYQFSEDYTILKRI